MTTTKVAVVGASGETGSSLVEAFLTSKTQKFEVLAVTRPRSVNKPENLAFKKRGVQVIPIELSGPLDDIVKVLVGVDTVISTLPPLNTADQIPLIDAAKLAGVKRYVPCGFGPVMPAHGVAYIREEKEKMIEYTRAAGLAWTYIEVGWWYHLALPYLPSGRMDYARLAVAEKINVIHGGGNAPSARIDLPDIGRWVEKVITDDRTLNRMVFVFNEVLTTNQIHDITKKVSREDYEVKQASVEDVLAEIAAAKKVVEDTKKEKGAADWGTLVKLYQPQYMYSLYVRGDNTPEHATELGYLLGPELYPDMLDQTVKYETFVKQVLSGKAKEVYPWLAEMLKANKM